MVSFFRRKKPGTDAASPSPQDTTRRFSLEELAAAFPDASPRPATEAHESDESVEVLEADAPVAPVEPTANPAAITPTLEIEPAPEPVAVAVAVPIPTPAPAIVATPVVAAPPVPATQERLVATSKTTWRDRLRGTGFALGLGGLFSRNPRLDEDLLDEIETALLTADVGVPATTALIDSLRKRMKLREFADANALLQALRADLIALLVPVAVPLQIDTTARPFVVLTVGVNGVGKTTTIGKLARRFKEQGHPLMLAAGDTFRAAAVAQLQTWGERNGVPVIAQGQDADPASVAFDALQAAKARGTEVLIADTAGRLHTQQGLMAELGKIRRVLGKLDPAAPHEVLMVIDGTTGQNALSQLRQFHAAVGVTGLVVTKLDGTAKGGVVFALAREFGIPIRFAGIGERPEDLRVFDAEAFVDALLPEALGA